MIGTGQLATAVVVAAVGQVGTGGAGSDAYTALKFDVSSPGVVYYDGRDAAATLGSGGASDFGGSAFGSVGASSGSGGFSFDVSGSDALTAEFASGGTIITFAAGQTGAAGVGSAGSFGDAGSGSDLGGNVGLGSMPDRMLSGAFDSIFVTPAGGDVQASITAVAVPLPQAAGMGLVGLAGIGAMRRRRL